jgi:hypothetical protein
MSFPKTSFSVKKLGAAAVLAMVAACGGSSSATHLVIWTEDSDVIANDDNLSFNVAAVDGDNRLVPTYTGTWTVTTSDSAAAAISPYAVKAADLGQANFAVHLGTAGTTTLTVKDGSGLTGSTSVTVVALAPVIVLSYSSVPIPAAGKTPVFPALLNGDGSATPYTAKKYAMVATVEIQDQDGRDLPGATNTVGFAFSAVPSAVNVGGTPLAAPTTYYEAATAASPTPAATAFTSYTFVAGDAGKHLFGLQFPSSGSSYNDSKYKLTVSDSAAGTSITPAPKSVAFTSSGKISSASHLVLTFPSGITKGTATSFTVTAEDKYNQLLKVSDDSCTDPTVPACVTLGNTTAKLKGVDVVTFTASSSDATSVYQTTANLPADYTFAAGDNSVTPGQPIVFLSSGTYKIVATDSATSGDAAGITGSASVVVP